MPQIIFDKISEFSSEDSANKLFANNLLRNKDFKSWKCKEWEAQSYVILDVNEAQRVHSIEIGNDCSAFTEVLVANRSEEKSRFQVLLSTSSFMTPSDSHSLSNCNRIRVFETEKLSPKARNEKWNRFKIVCSQPFNKTLPYGLAFIRFNSSEDKEERDESNTCPLNIGPFRLRNTNEDQDSDIDTGSLFSKRTNQSNSESPNVSTRSSLAAAIGLSPRSPKSSDKKNSSNTSVKPKTNTNPKHVSTPNTSHNTTSITPKAGPSPPKRQRKQPKDKPFNQLMSKVVFTLSGFVNPKRGELREKAIQMGAKYRADWDQSCTHLICAFANTPKFNEVMNKNGRIVKEKWIDDCFNQKRHIYWRNYILGKYNGPDSEESDEEEDEAPAVSIATTQASNNKKRLQYIDDEDEDESLMKEVIGFGDNSNDKEFHSIDIDMNDEIYDMETDTNESTSGETTADNTTNTDSKNKCDETIDSKPIDIFKKKCFHFYGPFEEKEKQILTQYIITHNGQLESDLTPSVKYVVTYSDWNDDFEQACSENESLIFVKPKWIYKCHEKSKLIPFQPFIVSANYD